MSGLTLTRRGRLVRAVVLLVALVAVAVALFTLVHLMPGATPAHFTDAQWRDALAAARAAGAR